MLLIAHVAKLDLRLSSMHASQMFVVYELSGVVAQGMAIQQI